MAIATPQPTSGFAARPHRPGPRADMLTPAQRRVMVGLIIGAHGALAWGLLQVREVRDMASQVAPMFVNLVAPESPPKPPAPPPPAPVPQKPVRIEKPVIATPPAPAETRAAFTVPPPPPEPEVVAAPAPPVQAQPAPPPAPRLIPASAVQYLEPPGLVYPRASRRAGESGRVVLRVFIDEAGLPRQVQVNQSTGFARLDEAAINAVQKARFKPYSDNGQPVAGWALVPLSFDLEK